MLNHTLDILILIRVKVVNVRYLHRTILKIDFEINILSTVYLYLIGNHENFILVMLLHSILGYRLD